MDELLGIDLIDCAGDNLAAIAPMVIFPASADKRVVTRYGEVTSASFARPGSATYIAASGEVEQVGVDVPRVGSTGWILEGSAINTALWSNSFTAEHGHTLNDCTTSVSPTEYLMTDESGAPRYATILTATANTGRVGRYSLSVTAGTKVNWSIHVKAISGKFRFAGYDGSKAVSVLFDCATRAFSNLSDPGSISSQLQYEYLGNDWFKLSVTITPSVTSSTAAASIGLELAGNSGYISGAQFVEGSVVTSYVYTEASAVTRASEGADTSGNGLSIPLSRAMIDSLAGELCPNYDFSGTYTSGLAHDWVKSGSPTVSQETTDTDGAAAVQRVSCPAGTGNNWIYADSHIRVVPGAKYQIDIKSKLVNGASPNYCNVALSVNPWSIIKIFSPLTTAWGTQTATITIPSNYTGAITVFLGNKGTASASEFLLGKVSIRRVLDSGQTNPGEGTVLCGVYLPYSTSLIASNHTQPVLSVANSIDSLFTIRRSAGGTLYINRIYDGINTATLTSLDLTAGYYVLIAQFSATTSQMRVGLYNPATGVLTWSSSTLAGGTAYRGFFPIYGTGDQQRLRFLYGGGSFPIHVEGLRWLNSIGSDAECVRLSKEMLP